MYSDDDIGPLREFVKAVHDAGGKIVAQISHAGCEAVAQPAGRTRLGPSAVERNGRPRCLEMTRDDLVRLTEDFAGAAFRAKEAGFDGVQLHAAHGYLISEFLSPYRNKRQDSYGGSIENRARILLQAFEAVRAAVGAGFGIMVKINSEDFREDGLTVGEMLAVSAMLEERGIDAIEMSGGRVFSRGFSPHTTWKTDDEAYYLEAARAYKEKVRRR